MQVWYCYTFVQGALPGYLHRKDARDGTITEKDTLERVYIPVKVGQCLICKACWRYGPGNWIPDQKYTSRKFHILRYAGIANKTFRGTKALQALAGVCCHSRHGRPKQRCGCGVASDLMPVSL
jgi:hypothetical protein